MADSGCIPTLVWDGGSLVWDSNTLIWDGVPPPPTQRELLTAKADRARVLTAQADRARILEVKRGNRRV